MFYPSVSLELSRVSNVLLSSDDFGAIPSGVVVGRLNLKMDMPLGAHHIRWSYSPQYKDYSTDRFVNDDPFSHFFDFESSFQLGRSFSIGFVDHIVRGVTELQEILPGGESVFGLTPFRLHEPRLNMEFRFGARQRLVVTPRYARARFDEAGASTFLSFDTKAIDARYGYRVSRPAELFVFYAREETDQARNNQGIIETRLLNEAAGIGFSRSINDNVITSFSMGYSNVEVEGGEGAEGEDFNGLSFDATGNWRLTDLMQISVTGERRPFQSFFLNNNYFISNQVSVRLIHQIGSRTFWQALARYRVSDYPNEILTGDDTFLPSVGIKRRDTSGEAEIGVSYRFSSSMRMFLGYNYRQRRSNIESCVESPNLSNNSVCDGAVISPFNFSDDRIVFRVEAGWL